MHCYSSHFFDNLINTTGEYNYQNLCRWGRLISKGLAQLGVLYATINICNFHWIFIKVDVQQKQIEMYCSFGAVNHENRKYLTAMRRYVYDELHKDIPELQRPTYQA